LRTGERREEVSSRQRDELVLRRKVEPSGAGVITICHGVVLRPFIDPVANVIVEMKTVRHRRKILFVYVPPLATKDRDFKQCQQLDENVPYLSPFEPVLSAHH
jgi:hypothetical protein